MKDKTLTGLLAIFLGWAGIHRFYLGQVKLGIFYVISMFVGVSLILGLIDAVVFLTMDQEDFDDKYNSKEAHYERTSRRRASGKDHVEDHPPPPADKLPLLLEKRIHLN